jgi:hypothetical protein
MRPFVLVLVAACDMATPPPDEPIPIAPVEKCVADVLSSDDGAVVRFDDSTASTVSTAGAEPVLVAPRGAGKAPIPAHKRGYVDATLDHGRVTVALRDERDRSLGRYRFVPPRGATGIADLRWWDANAVVVAIRYATTNACSVVAVPLPKDLP